MKILVKIPSRSRPHQCMERVMLMKSLQLTNSVKYIVSLDRDDNRLTDYKIPGTKLITGDSKTKVEAYNRDIPKKGWDIMIVSSDDMRCVKPGWDVIIQAAMKRNFPDTGGVLWFNDGHVGNKLNTLPIIGRKRYEHFGYVYHPDYTSLWCDNEFMEVNADKQIYNDLILFDHAHPAWDKTVRTDELYKRNESFFHSDKIVYESRQRQGFPK